MSRRRYQLVTLPLPACHAVHRNCYSVTTYTCRPNGPNGPSGAWDRAGRSLTLALGPPAHRKSSGAGACLAAPVRDRKSISIASTINACVLVDSTAASTRSSSAGESAAGGTGAGRRRSGAWRRSRADRVGGERPIRAAAMATGARGAVARGAGLAGQQSMIHLELGEARIFVRPGAIDLVSEAGYGGSASALPVSRPAQRSLTLRPACSLNRPQAILLHRSASVQFVTSLHRSDCFRLERQLPGGIRTRWDTAPFHGAR